MRQCGQQSRRKWISEAVVCQNHLVGLLKHRWLGCLTHSLWFSRSGKEGGLKISMRFKSWCCYESHSSRRFWKCPSENNQYPIMPKKGNAKKKWNASFLSCEASVSSLWCQAHLKAAKGLGGQPHPALSQHSRVSQPLAAGFLAQNGHLWHLARHARHPDPEHRLCWDARCILLAIRQAWPLHTLWMAASEQTSGLLQTSRAGGNKQNNLWNLIPVPDTSSNKLSDKAVKICFTALIGKRSGHTKKFSKTKSVAKLGGLTACSGIHLDQNRNTSKGASVSINYYGMIRNN